MAPNIGNNDGFWFAGQVLVKSQWSTGIQAPSSNCVKQMLQICATAHLCRWHLRRKWESFEMNDQQLGQPWYTHLLLRAHATLTDRTVPWISAWYYFRRWKCSHAFLQGAQTKGWAVLSLHADRLPNRGRSCLEWWWLNLRNKQSVHCYIGSCKK